jgi:hypothetical protein
VVNGISSTAPHHRWLKRLRKRLILIGFSSLGLLVRHPKQSFRNPPQSEKQPSSAPFLAMGQRFGLPLDARAMNIALT